MDVQNVLQLKEEHLHLPIMIGHHSMAQYQLKTPSTPVSLLRSIAFVTMIPIKRNRPTQRAVLSIFTVSRFFLLIQSHF